VCEAIEKCHARADAAELAGIGASTLREWCVRGRAGREPFAAFLAAVKKARGEGNGIVPCRISVHTQRNWKQDRSRAVMGCSVLLRIAVRHAGVVGQNVEYAT
jgi:hypothetical protein